MMQSNFFTTTDSDPHFAGYFTLHDHSSVMSLMSRFPAASDHGVMSIIETVSRAMAAIPYENLTKAIAWSQKDAHRDHKQTPDQILKSFVTYGTGGTCFSLTATFIALLDYFRIPASPILADRAYGSDTHCAVLIQTVRGPAILDPGYLILKPLPVSSGNSVRKTTPFSTLELRRVAPDRYELFTLASGSLKYRLTYKTGPVDRERFVKVWDDSFSWDMMAYPVLSLVQGSTQVYLQKNFLQQRSFDEMTRVDIQDTDRIALIANTFGIHPEIVRQGLIAMGFRG